MECNHTPLYMKFLLNQSAYHGWRNLLHRLPSLLLIDDLHITLTLLAHFITIKTPMYSIQFTKLFQTRDSIHSTKYSNITQTCTYNRSIRSVGPTRNISLSVIIRIFSIVTFALQNLNWLISVDYLFTTSIKLSEIFSRWLSTIVNVTWRYIFYSVIEHSICSFIPYFIIYINYISTTNVISFSCTAHLFNSIHFLFILNFFKLRAKPFIPFHANIDSVYPHFCGLKQEKRTSTGTIAGAIHLHSTCTYCHFIQKRRGKLFVDIFSVSFYL